MVYLLQVFYASSFSLPVSTIDYAKEDIKVLTVVRRLLEPVFIAAESRTEEDIIEEFFSFNERC
ncbi:MAG TPA: hypothetical protein VK072_07910 [Candidatus Avamphibacillus sp.]|nr:hypothetical protein [Candidatus Avamphibacillus sp.]